MNGLGQFRSYWRLEMFLLFSILLNFKGFWQDRLKIENLSYHHHVLLSFMWDFGNLTRSLSDQGSFANYVFVNGGERFKEFVTVQIKNIFVKFVIREESCFFYWKAGLNQKLELQAPSLNNKNRLRKVFTTILPKI